MKMKRLVHPINRLPPFFRLSYKTVESVFPREDVIKGAYVFTAKLQLFQQPGNGASNRKIIKLLFLFGRVFD